MTNLTDVERITNEIIATIPTVYDDNIVEFIEPTNTLQLKLFKMVIRKTIAYMWNTLPLQEKTKGM